MDKRERVATAIKDAGDWLFEDAELYRMADAAITALEPEMVQEAARVLLEKVAFNQDQVGVRARFIGFERFLRALAEKDTE
jgi:hypothetical protein